MPADVARPRARALYLALALVSGTVSARAQSAAALVPTTWIVPGSRYRACSSGGFFALQLGVSFSSSSRAWHLRRRTYDCAGQSNYTACMYNATPGIAAVDREHEKLERQSDRRRRQHRAPAHLPVYRYQRHDGWTARDGPGLPAVCRHRTVRFRRKREVRQHQHRGPHLPDRLRRQRRQRLQHLDLAVHQQLPFSMARCGLAMDPRPAQCAQRRHPGRKPGPVRSDRIHRRRARNGCGRLALRADSLRCPASNAGSTSRCTVACRDTPASGPSS